MNKKTVLVLALSLLYATNIVVYWLRLGFYTIYLRETLYLLTSFLGVMGGFFALRNFGWSTARSRTLLFLTIGIGYWFLGETLFDYYQYILNINPYPSAADIFYILGYVFMFIGLVNETRITKINWKAITKPTLFFYLLVALLFALFIAYFGIYQAYDPAKNLLTNIVGMGYGVGDLLLILANLFVLILVWEFRGGKLSRFWIFLFLSFVLMLVADILFAIYSDQYNEQVWFYKSLLDSFWMASYLLFAYAFFDWGLSVSELSEKMISQQKKSASIKSEQAVTPTNV